MKAFVLRQKGTGGGVITIQILTYIDILQKVQRKVVQILSYRNDLIDTIKPFIEQLNNNDEKFNINEEKHIPFLKSFSNFQNEVLHKYEIIDEKIYKAIIPKKDFSPKKFSFESLQSDKTIIREIIQGDKLEEMQRLIREKGINTI